MSILLALALATTPATTDAATMQEADSRCLALTAVAVGKAADEKAKISLMSGLFYFIGKLKARDPAYDIEKEMRRIYAAFAGKPDFATAEMTRCSTEIVGLATEMSTAGKALQAKP
jgi:hypothetical protein